MKRRLVNLISDMIDIVVVLLLLILLIYSTYAMINEINISNSAKLSDEILHLKPNIENPEDSIKNLKEFNDYIFAWIELDNTSINYPVVQGKDNLEFLKENYYGEYSATGAIFLDYRNNQNLTDFYSIIYGHHMDNSRMFGDLDLYKDQDFFDNNKSGRIYLESGTYELEIFASAVVSSYDSSVFSTSKYSEYERGRFLNYIKDSAIFYRNINISTNDKIVALSTCTNDFTDGRFVLFAKILQ